MADKEIKIVVTKTEDGMNRLELSGIYEKNCSSAETVIVSDEVLEVFENARRAQERERSRERRHGIKKIHLGSDEDFDAKLGLTTDAPDRAVEDKLYLEYLRRFFDEKTYRRGMLYYLHKFSQDEIAEMEGVSQSAVNKSITKFKMTIVKLYKNRR